MICLMMDFVKILLRKNETKYIILWTAEVLSVFCSYADVWRRYEIIHSFIQFQWSAIRNQPESLKNVQQVILTILGARPPISTAGFEIACAEKSNVLSFCFKKIAWMGCRIRSFAKTRLPGHTRIWMLGFWSPNFLGFRIKNGVRILCCLYDYCFTSVFLRGLRASGIDRVDASTALAPTSTQNVNAFF